MHAIAAASEEQSASSEEINRSISNVNEMSRQTTVAMSEASKAIHDLANQSERLIRLYSRPKKNEHFTLPLKPSD